MRKFGHLIILIIFVGILYLMMMMFQPSINAMIETANSSVNWSANEHFPLAQAAMVGWPFWAYLVPAGIGIAGAIGILKGE